jgi:hypothetical protein
MNKTHHAGRTGARGRTSIPAASVRRSLLESEDEAMEAPWMSPLSSNEEDWPEVESDPRDVESELNLLLNGVSYR